MITPVDNSLLIYKLFKDIFKGFKFLEKDFEIVKRENSIRFIPKNEFDFDFFEVVLDGKSLKYIKSQDKDENEILITITKIDRCKGKPKLNINKDTEIINQY
jgi:hypothetical protein